MSAAELHAALVAGQFARARDLAREALALDRDDAYARATLGAALLHLGELPEAVLELAAAAALDSADAGSRFNRALALDSLGRLEEAADSYREALSTDPTLLPAALNLGAALSRTGDVAGSEAAYRQALAIDPSSSIARHMLAAFEGSGATEVPADYVRAVFASAAPTFDSHLAELGYRTPALLAELVGQRARTLDLGCGTGLFGAAMAAPSEHLAGVDLSAQMLERASARGIYDELHTADIGDFLAADARSWDLIAAADVLVYIGDLEPLLGLAAKRLAPGGVVGFSVELSTGEDPWALRRSGRFAHRRDYIDAVAARCRLEPVEFRETELRRERGEPVAGALFVLSG